jgi:Tol biopolymer transport system component
VIHRNGEKLLTTNFGDFSETTHVMSLSWSPNGRYIAFWYTNDKNRLFTNLQLAIWDTETLTTSHYCVNSGDDYLRYSPIWSPASDYLILAYKASEQEETFSSLLLDISDGKAWIIKPDYEPLGWLK